MSFLGKAIGGRLETKVLDASALSWDRLFGGPPAKSGVAVNIDSAMRVTAVFACLRVISEGIAQLPLKLQQVSPDGSKRLAKEHPLYKKLFRKPNDFQTSFEWRETMMLHAGLDIGGFSVISRNSRGEVLELLPVLPGRVRVIQDSDYSVKYEISDLAGRVTTLPKSQVLHLKGPSWNTFSAMPAVAQAREAIGLSIAAEENLSRLYSNGARPSGVLSNDKALAPEVMERIRRNFLEGYAGLQNAFKTILLDAGWKFSQMSLSPVDSQTHESRKNQIEEICRVFRVFPQMVGYGDKTSTYASAEQFFMAHVTHTLMPWIERFQQQLDADLLTEDERDAGYEFKFNVSALLRGDAKSRAEYYSSGILNGWLARNEVRRLEDFDPLPGLDEPLVPLNMATQSEKAAAAKTAQPGGADMKAFAHELAEELGQPHLEEKIGRVISLRNEKKLKQARDLVDEVLQQVDAQAAA